VFSSALSVYKLHNVSIVFSLIFIFILFRVVFASLVKKRRV
jgi:hypothetical protein